MRGHVQFITQEIRTPMGVCRSLTQFHCLHLYKYWTPLMVYNSVIRLNITPVRSFLTISHLPDNLKYLMVWLTFLFVLSRVKN